jgi:hypothetical protein
MRRLLTVVMVLSFTLVTVMVPSSRIAAAFVGSQGSQTYLKAYLASGSGHRSETPAKPCSRGVTILSCAFLPPAAPVTIAIRQQLDTIAILAEGPRSAGREITPPSRPPKYFSA